MFNRIHFPYLIIQGILEKKIDNGKYPQCRTMRNFMNKVLADSKPQFQFP